MSAYTATMRTIVLVSALGGALGSHSGSANGTPEPTCVYEAVDGKQGFNCSNPFNHFYPSCPSNAESFNQCDTPGYCMGCTEGAGFECGCTDAGPHLPDASTASGSVWICVGTGYTCQ